MELGDLNRLLDVALDGIENRVSLTVTEPPEGEINLRRLLWSAIHAGERHGSGLAEIQISLSTFPTLGTDFLDVPVTDSGDPGVLRLIYEPTVLAPAA